MFGNQGRVSRQVLQGGPLQEGGDRREDSIGQR